MRWRTREAHHCAQQQGREEVLEDYHLRVGEAIVDKGGGSREDVTRVGTGPAVTLLEIGGGVMTEREEADTLACAMGLDTSPWGLCCGMFST